MTSLPCGKMSAAEFFATAKKQLADARAFNLTEHTYNRLSRGKKKIVCILGNGYKGVKLEQRHIDLLFSEMSPFEKQAIQYGLKEIHKLSDSISRVLSIYDC